MSYTTRDFFYDLSSVVFEAKEQKIWLVEAFEKIAKTLVENVRDYKGCGNILFAIAGRIYRDLGYKEFDVDKYLEICKNNVNIEAYEEVAEQITDKDFYFEAYVTCFITESMLKAFKGTEESIALSVDDFKAFMQERLKSKADD